MNGFDYLIFSFVEHAGFAILHSIWVFALAAIFVAMLFKIIPKTQSAIRHNIAGACLFLMLIAWGAFFLLAPLSSAETATWLDSNRNRLGDKSVLDDNRSIKQENPDENFSEKSFGSHTESNAESIDKSKSSRVSTNVNQNVYSSWSPFSRLGLPDWVKLAVIIVWLAGFLFLSFRHVVSYGRLLAFRKNCQTIPGSRLTERIQRVHTRLGLRKQIAILQSGQIIAPVVFGWIRPTLVVPVSFMSGLSTAHVDAIISHELAHIRRHDFLWKLIQLFIEALFFYHPAIWWISRQLQIERESCCDNQAIANGATPLDLAEAIATIENRRHELALAFGDTNTSAARVQRLLLKPNSTKRSSIFGSVMFASINFAIIGLVGVISLSTFSRSKPAHALPIHEIEKQNSIEQIVYIGNKASWSARYLRQHAIKSGYRFEAMTFEQSDNIESSIEAAQKTISNASCLVIGDEEWNKSLRPIEDFVHDRVESGELNLIFLGKHGRFSFTADSPLNSLAPVKNFHNLSAEYFALNGQYRIGGKSKQISLYSLAEFELKEGASAVVEYQHNDKSIPVVARLQDNKVSTTFVGVNGLFRLRRGKIGQELFRQTGNELIATSKNCKQIMLIGQGNSWDMQLFRKQWRRSGIVEKQLDLNRWSQDKSSQQQSLDDLEASQVLIISPEGIDHPISSELSKEIERRVTEGNLHLVVFSHHKRLLTDFLPEALIRLLPVVADSRQPLRETKKATISLDGSEIEIDLTQQFNSFAANKNAIVRSNIAVDGTISPFIVESSFGKGRTTFVATNELWRTRKSDPAAYSKIWNYLIEKRSKTNEANHGFQDDDPGLKNASFKEWKDKLPVGWNVSVGAKNGAEKPLSQIYSDGSALVLKGDGSTRAWQIVQQSVELKSGETYLLTCETKAEGIRREGIQFNNCYVGLFFKNSRSQVIGNKIENITEGDWKTQKIMFRVPEGGAAGDVSIFLSKTGKLTVRNFGLRRYSEKDSFQILVDEMDRHYSFFDLKKMNWKELSEKYRDRAEQAKSDLEFCNVVAEMLAELKDIHTWTRLPNGKQIVKYGSGHKPNYGFGEVKKQLKDVKEFAKSGFIGRTAEGYGYIAVTSLVDKKSIEKLAGAAEDMFDAAGFIVDLRLNNGGGEGLAKIIAELFNDEKRVYAKSKFRSGAKYDEFTDAIPRHFGPRHGKTFTKPVVCLIGPGCVSSGEAFAMMMSCLPHVTVVGKPTRGASGNPGVITLPNGVDVGYSRWLSLMPDETLIEGAGVPPDIEMDHEDDGDTTFQQSKSVLKEMIEIRK